MSQSTEALFREAQRSNACVPIDRQFFRDLFMLDHYRFELWRNNSDPIKENLGGDYNMTNRKCFSIQRIPVELFIDIDPNPSADQLIIDYVDTLIQFAIEHRANHGDLALHALFDNALEIPESWRELEIIFPSAQWASEWGQINFGCLRWDNNNQQWEESLYAYAGEGIILGRHVCLLR